MSPLLAVVSAVVALFSVLGGVDAELNECLGVEMSQLQTIPTCTMLFTACEIGVSKLNQQLHMAPELRFSPVSVISASESQANTTDDTLIAMLMQLAPLIDCVETTGESKTVSVKRYPVMAVLICMLCVCADPPTSFSACSCAFDMSKVEIYSILMTLDSALRWSLGGFKHHALAGKHLLKRNSCRPRNTINSKAHILCLVMNLSELADERAEIVEQYKKGKFYGTNLAVGIFDTPNLPLDSVSNSEDKSFARSPVGIFVALGSAVVSIGLLFHHRRRLNNGYAPIVIMKRGQLQAKTPSNPQLATLRHPNPVPVNEETTIKHEQNERFAV